MSMNMKKTLFIVLIGALCTTISHAHIPEAEALASEKPKVLFHLNQKEKGGFLISSVNNYLTSHPDADIEIVVNSSGVLRLIKNGGLNDELESLIKRGVAIGACNNAIFANNVDPSVLVSGVDLLSEGGISKIVTLQNTGYVYVKI